MKAKVGGCFLAGITLALFGLLSNACTTLPASTPAQDSAGVTVTTGAQAEAERTTTPATEEVTEEATEEAVVDEAAARLKVPPGFTLNTYFIGLVVPRLMTVGPDGHLYVAERLTQVVVRLVDVDGDGIADQRQVVADKLIAPHNMEWFEGSLYVAGAEEIVRLTDQNGDGDARDEGERATVTENIPGLGGHDTRTLHFGPDGKLYVSAGSSNNNGYESDRRRATIMRFNTDGTIPEDNPFAQDPEETRRPVWAEGLRNSVDFLFLPDGRLWANHNGSDALGDDLPPEEIVIEIEKGKHYGWPYCYTATLGVVPAGEIEVQDASVAFDEWLSDCSQATPALFTDLAHLAPLGMAQYNHSAFPTEYHGGLFVAYHGSWNSTVPRDCKVQWIVVRDGQPVDSRPFVTGFHDLENQPCDAAWGRPAGIAIGANGELFISDDKNGNIYRVVYSGGQ